MHCRGLFPWMILLTTLATLQLLAIEPDPAKQPPKGKPNHLARETSPYLLLHAHNPVDWYPWGDEAFAKAKKENKLIFLSIGYSSCYWCHVMERESFANDEVAKILNEHFVCIKVDREERPDVDAIYMAALQVQGKSGGWPLSMFMLPDGKPIVGGTYWPREDREVAGGTMRGFKTVLTLVHEDWKKNRQGLEEYAGKVAEAVQRSLAPTGPRLVIGQLDEKLVLESVDNLKAEYDDQFGGFGSKERHFRGPKFPRPPLLELLLLHHRQAKDDEALKMVRYTLDKMALGGIYDQVGGGFHRYSTDRAWKVPHFEKMLYDNAQMASLYAHAFQTSKQPFYRRIAEETLAFVARELTAPTGGFYSALDAETEAEEGKYYVWTRAEIAKVLAAKDAELVGRAYAVDGGPNFEKETNILLWPRSPAEVAKGEKLTEDQLLARLRPLRDQLLQARNQRPRPLLDTKVLTGWNGLMIAGYADAATAFNEPAHLKPAVKAAEFVLKNLRDDKGRLLRTHVATGPDKGEAKLNAYLEDYAYLAYGLLALHDATRDDRWLTEAQRLTDAMIDRFEDKESGGFFYTSHDHEKLFARSKDQYDGVTPSANSVAALNLVRLAQKTKLPKYRDQAEKVLKSFAPAILTNPSGLTAMARAVALWRETAGGATASGETASGTDAKKPEDVVEVTAEADPREPGPDGKQTVTVTLKVAKGWHVYANPAGVDELIPTTVQVASTTKLAKTEIKYPQGEEYKPPVLDKPARVYQGKTEIKVAIERGRVDGKVDRSPVEVSVKYQACDDKACQLPKTVKVKVGG